MPVLIPANIPSVGPKTLALLSHNGIETNLDVVLAGEDGHVRINGLGPAKWSLVWGWAWESLSGTDRLAMAEAIAGLNIEEEFEAWVEKITPDDSRYGWKKMYEGDSYAGVSGMRNAHTCLLESMQEDAEARLDGLSERLIHGVDSDTELKIRRCLDERRERLVRAVRFQREREEKADKEAEASERAGCLKVAALAAIFLLGIVCIAVVLFKPVG